MKMKVVLAALVVLGLSGFYYLAWRPMVKAEQERYEAIEKQRRCQEARRAAQREYERTATYLPPNVSSGIRMIVLERQRRSGGLLVARACGG